LRKRYLTFCLLGFFVFTLAFAGTQAEKKSLPPAKAALPMYQLADDMAKRLGDDLKVKTIVGEPMKIGKITLVPIIMLDIGFGGGGGGAPQNPDMGGKGYYMSGEARPIGFVVISKAGTQFLSVGKIPQK